MGEMTAFRPQHGGGYAPFARTAVPGADEDSATLGPGIRINEPGDTDPAGEDDLIEIELVIDPPGAQLALRRSDPALRVWTTRDKSPGTEIAFVDDKTLALPFGPSETELTVWVEWACGSSNSCSASRKMLSFWKRKRATTILRLRKNTGSQ